jgi:cytochrome c-type biogenesis protein CcmH
MTGFWAGAVALTIVALAFLLLPLWRERKRSGQPDIIGQLAAVAIAPVAILLYGVVTTFDPELADEVEIRLDESELLGQLEARLAEDPNDINGWVLLGRSYIQLGDYERAREALEQAWNRSDAPDDLLKLAYAQTLLFTVEGSALSLGGDLVEEVLATSPDNEAAMLWGGIVAIERNQPTVAAERWTALLATRPPPEIENLIRNQLVMLTGAPVAASTPADTANGPVIDIEVGVADSINLEQFGSNARLFVIARASDSPAPIAVAPYPLSSLPGRYSLSDADAMIPGRSMSQYEAVTIVARISGSGEALEQSGDVYAEATVDPAAAETVSLVIDKIVP